MKSIGRIPVNKGKKYEELYEESVAKELKNKIKEARKNQIFPKNDTQIEIKIQNYLKELNIEFFTHYYTKEINHAYQCDILIPVQNNINKKTIIECDGDYWHGNPNKYILPNEFQLKQIEEDKTRTEELIDQGFRVIRLWESDIKQLNINTFQIIL
jgi:very-short-patch-repair endonuclease